MPPDARHLLIRSEALDAVDARSSASPKTDARASASPKTDARASTTWRLQPPSASLVLWRKPRNPPSVAACALDPGVDATAAARSELRSRLPFTAVHRTVHRPQHLHGSSPSTLDARVPAIQRPSARSHRTVDNLLITGRVEYSRSSKARENNWLLACYPTTDLLGLLITRSRMPFALNGTNNPKKWVVVCWQPIFRKSKPPDFHLIT